MLSSKEKMIENVEEEACETQSHVYRDDEELYGEELDDEGEDMLLHISKDSVIALYKDEDNPDSLVLQFYYHGDYISLAENCYWSEYAIYVSDYYKEYLLQNGWREDDEEFWWINDNNDENIKFIADLIERYDFFSYKIMEEYAYCIETEVITLNDSPIYQFTEAMKKEGINYHISDNGQKITYNINYLESKLKETKCEICFDSDGCSVYAYSKVEAELKSLFEMFKYLHMANYRMIRSNFEINPRTGEIRLKTRFDVDWYEGELIDYYVYRIIFTSPHVLDIYGNGILALSLDLSNADDEIEKVEQSDLEDTYHYKGLKFSEKVDDIPF